MSKKKKIQKLKNLKPRQYRLYGIFNFKTNELIYVSIDEESAEMAFDLNNYNADHDIVSFEVLLT